MTPYNPNVSRLQVITGGLLVVAGVWLAGRGDTLPEAPARATASQAREACAGFLRASGRSVRTSPEWRVSTPLKDGAPWVVVTHQGFVCTMTDDAQAWRLVSLRRMG